jgi:16S rRNA (guanine527-N7)-methyltransferase
MIRKPNDSDTCLLPGNIAVSRETMARLEVYESLLRLWQNRLNLVAESTLPNLWERHFADSAQIVDLLPGARRWVDMGSGAGFPGLVVAICMASVPGAHVDLIESDQRKAAFLREVSRETGAPAQIHNDRIEHVIESLPVPDAVCARALARLEKLVRYARPLLIRGAQGVFLKGREVASELTEIRQDSTVKITLMVSKTDPEGRIVLVSQGSPS